MILLEKKKGLESTVYTYTLGNKRENNRINPNKKRQEIKTKEEVNEIKNWKTTEKNKWNKISSL